MECSYETRTRREFPGLPETPVSGERNFSGAPSWPEGERRVCGSGAAQDDGEVHAQAAVEAQGRSGYVVFGRWWRWLDYWEFSLSFNDLLFNSLIGEMKCVEVNSLNSEGQTVNITGT